MYVACHEGHLSVCKWLFEVGAATDITKANNNGATPMWIACQQSHLPVCKWLFESGAAADITKADNDGNTPMFGACEEATLDYDDGEVHVYDMSVCDWLLEVGAAADLAKANDKGETPMQWACFSSYDVACHWLITNGALNDPTGHHVDAAIVHRDHNHFRHPSWHPDLLAWAQEVLAIHHTFLHVVLRASVILPHRRMSPRRRCHLPQLPRGVLERVGAFVGVKMGRRLRNVREFADIVEAALSPTGYLTRQNFELKEVLSCFKLAGMIMPEETDGMTVDRVEAMWPVAYESGPTTGSFADLIGILFKLKFLRTTIDEDHFELNDADEDDYYEDHFELNDADEDDY
jgi:hypothetical protein